MNRWRGSESDGLFDDFVSGAGLGDLDTKTAAIDPAFETFHRQLTDEERAIDRDFLMYCGEKTAGVPCWRTLLMIEAARDIGQSTKTVGVLRELGKDADKPAWLVFYTPSSTDCNGRSRCQIPDCEHGISSFRVQTVTPSMSRSVIWTPQVFVARMRAIRNGHRATHHLDVEFIPVRVE